jgi:hypothetical protein
MDETVREVLRVLGKDPDAMDSDEAAFANKFINEYQRNEVKPKPMATINHQMPHLQQQQPFGNQQKHQPPPLISSPFITGGASMQQQSMTRQQHQQPPPRPPPFAPAAATSSTTVVSVGGGPSNNYFPTSTVDIRSHQQQVFALFLKI